MSKSKTSKRWLWIIALWCVMLLRLADLTARSMWADESLTLWRIAQSWSDNLRNIITMQGAQTIDTNPFVYFVLLKLWSLFAGETEFALKLYSAFFGVLIVPMTYRLARALLNKRSAIIAAALIAMSPAIQWYSHELRMYSLVACVSVIHVFAFYRALTLGGMRRWLMWVGTAIVALGTHYSFVTQIIALTVVALIALLRHEHVSNLKIAMACVAILSVGALLWVLSPDLQNLVFRLIYGSEQNYGFVPLRVVWDSVLIGFVFGLNATDITAGVLPWVITGALALFFVMRTITARVRWVLLASGILPIFMWYAISLIKPNYQGVRHLFIVLPMLSIILAGTLSYVAKWLDARAPRFVVYLPSAVMLVALLTTQIYGNIRTFTRTPDWQDDWRSLTREIVALSQSHDVVMLDSPILLPLFYLYAPTLKAVAPPLGRDVSALLATDVERIAPDWQRAWVVNGNASQLTFAPNAQQISAKTFAARNASLGLNLYSRASLITTTLSDVTPLGFAERNGVRLAGYQLRSEEQVSSAKNILSLYWQRGAQAQFTAPSVALRIKHDGVVWAEKVIAPSIFDFAPKDWTTSTYYRTDTVFDVPLGLPMQNYEYEWILRDANGGDVERVVMPALASDVTCCLRRATVATASQMLLSANLPTALHIGDVLPIALTWNAAANSNWTQTIELLPIVGAQPIQQSQQRIQVGASDNGAYRTLQSLQLPPTLGAGWYRLAVQRTDGQQDLHMLGMIHIEDYAPQTADIPIPQKLNAQVGEFALLGHDLVNRTWRAGDKINFNLVWQLNKKTSREGVFFVHVIGADGKPILQRDAAPFNGARSTVTFRVGDHYADSYTFTVPADAPRGKYTLYAGIYNRTDVTRWAAAQDGQPARDDLIVIAEVEVQ